MNNSAHDFSDALGLLERYVDKAELIQALWLELRLHDSQDDLPMAFTLTMLVHQVNTIRRLNGDARPVLVPTHARALRDHRQQGAERLALACASALGLAGDFSPLGGP
jgi:hypothetical protein